MKKLVTIYVRKSRLKNDDEMEIERQIQLLVEYAESNNMEYKIFHEEGSSEKWDRPELQRMLLELELGIYDGVLVTEQDRLTRDSTDFGLFKRFCIQYGLLFYTLDRTYNFAKDEDNFMSGIQAEMDSHFMRITKRKLLRGRIQALENGVYFGVAPFGYTKSTGKLKKLVPIEEEAEIVKMAYNMFLYEKANRKQIADKINLFGFKTRENNKFKPVSVGHILSNSAYHGELRYDLKNRTIVNSNAHEAIIDKKLFDEVQLERSSRAHERQKSTITKHLLSRLLECSNCGTTLSFCTKIVGDKKTSTPKKELYVLNCFGSLSATKRELVKEKCTSYGVKAWRVEEAVMRNLEMHLSVLDAEIEEILRKGDSMLKNIRPKIEQIEKQLKQTDTQRERVHEGYEAGIYNIKETQEKLKKIEENKRKLEIEKEKLEVSDASSEIEKRKETKEKILKALSMDEDNENLNIVLRSIIEKIYYYKEKRDDRGLSPFQLHIVYK